MGGNIGGRARRGGPPVERPDRIKQRSPGRTQPVKKPRQSLTYDAVGVVTTGPQEGTLRELARWVNKTFDLNVIRPYLPLGYFANVLPLTPDLGLAISTDGVGTKLLVAQDLGKYDTIGIDCVAMNANDILCVGARPVSMVDYVAVQQARPEFLGEIGKGLYAGAEAAGISIPGGEVAQVREMISGSREGYGFDLVGTCVGTVDLQRVIAGQHVRPGDRVIGIASNGIHSNGLTLARHVLYERAKLRSSDRLAELGRTVGEELLTPTRIYVKEILRMMDAGLTIKALIHVTGDGLLNLARVQAPVGYVIDELLETPPIFSIIQRHGHIDDAEMFSVFNMGIGFCVVVDSRDVERVREIAREHGCSAATIGYAVADAKRRIWIRQRGLVGQDGAFRRAGKATPPPRPD